MNGYRTSKRTSKYTSRRTTLLLLSSLVLLVVLGMGTPGTFAQTGAPPRPGPDLIYPDEGGGSSQSNPDIFVSIWATPNVWVKRGDTLTYEIRVKNTGDDTAAEVPVYLPYDPAQLTIVGASSETGVVRLSRSTQNYVVITFVNVQVGTPYVAHLETQVSETLPDATVLAMRGFFKRKGQPSQTQHGRNYAVPAPDQDDIAATYRRTNYLPVLVGAVNESSPLVWMEGTPVEGQAGVVRFFSDRFVPGEMVTFWVNTPAGTSETLDITRIADEEGRITLDMSTDDYASGWYHLVAQGMESELTGSVPFAGK